MPTNINRRKFVQLSIWGAAGASIARTKLSRAAISPNEKINIGVVGITNQGGYDLSNVSTQNIVALCDIDDNFLKGTGAKYPAAKTYNDYRRMLEQKDIEAVVVATPDHTHAVATVAALQSGRHVYCEKPLTRTISECRIVRETTKKTKLVTQIGTQIHAGNNYRRVVELVKSGAIGPVKDVHVWVGSSYGNLKLPSETPPVPPNVHYDLWLGPVEHRPYHPEYLPFKWRNWWAFGGGSLADFGCHFMDLPHWALDLRSPLSAEAEGPERSPDSPPPWAIVHYKYPSRGTQPAVNLTWYHGGRKPGADVLAPELAAKWGNGVLFIGSKGMLLSDYSNHVLLPEKEYAGFVRPDPFIPNSVGHHKEWYEACKTGGSTTCNFDYSGALTEAALLGNVAFRVGKKLEWDSASLKATNCPEADEYIQHHYRKGWSL